MKVKVINEGWVKPSYLNDVRVEEKSLRQLKSKFDDYEYKSVLTNLLNEVKLTNAQIDNMFESGGYGLYIKDVVIGKQEYSNHAAGGALAEAYTYPISCTVVLTEDYDSYKNNKGKEVKVSIKYIKYRKF